MTFVANHPLLAALPAMKTFGTTQTQVQFTNFSETLTRVSSEIQMGAAFHEGEQPLAVVEDDIPQKGRGRGYFGAYVVTDRRIYGRGRYVNVADTVFDAWLSQIGSFAAMNVPFLVGPLTKFCERLALVPPAHRTMGPTSFAPSPGDQFGARAASYHAAGDPRAAALFRLADAAARAGRLAPDACTTLLERILLLDRHAVWGRGMHQGQWLTLLPRPVLREALVSFFGAPAWGASDACGETLDFALGRRDSGAGLSTAIGIASLAVLGVGWISVAGEAPPEFLRFGLSDAPCGSVFTLAAGTRAGLGRVPLSGARIFAATHRQLVKLEAKQLLADVVAAETPAESRLATPEVALAASARALVPPLDLRAFA